MDCICDKFVMVEDGEVFEMTQAAKGDPGPGVAPGGTTGQLLAKASDEDYDTEWIDQPEMDAEHVSYDSTETYSDGTVGKELGTINSALTSLSAVTEIIDTASGAIASFPDGSGLPMRSLLAQINPVQSGTGDPSPENVRPITGWTGLTGQRCGKNLIDVDDFTLVKSSARTNPIYFPYYLPAGQYTLSVNVPSNTATKNVQLAIRDKSGNPYVSIKTLAIPAGETGTFSTSFTADIPFSYIYAYMSTNDEDAASVTIEDIQLEVGSTASTYEPYTSLPITVSWQDSAGTVYGGTVDVVSGVLTADMPIVDMGTLGWVKAGAFRGFVATTNLPEGWPVVLSTDVIDAISDYYKTVSYNDISSQTVASMSARSPGTTDNKGLAIKDPSLDSYYDNFDATAFAAAVSGRHVVFKSTVPQTYQLTPQQISTLLGNNTVFVDTGSVSVTYQASIKGYIDKVLAS